MSIYFYKKFKLLGLIKAGLSEESRSALGPQRVRGSIESWPGPEPGLENI